MSKLSVISAIISVALVAAAIVVTIAAQSDAPKAHIFTIQHTLSNPNSDPNIAHLFSRQIHAKTKKPRFISTSSPLPLTPKSSPLYIDAEHTTLKPTLHIPIMQANLPPTGNAAPIAGYSIVNYGLAPSVNLSVDYQHHFSDQTAIRTKFTPQGQREYGSKNFIGAGFNYLF